MSAVHRCLILHEHVKVIVIFFTERYQIVFQYFQVTDSIKSTLDNIKFLLPSELMAPSYHNTAATTVATDLLFLSFLGFIKAFL